MLAIPIFLGALCAALPAQTAPIPCHNAGNAHFAPATQASVVRARGIGRPPRHLTGTRAHLMARRAGEVTAVRNLAKALGTRRVRGFRYVSYLTRADGTVEVTVEYRP